MPHSSTPRIVEGIIGRGLFVIDHVPYSDEIWEHVQRHGGRIHSELGSMSFPTEAQARAALPGLLKMAPRVRELHMGSSWYGRRVDLWRVVQSGCQDQDPLFRRAVEAQHIRTDRWQHCWD